LALAGDFHHIGPGGCKDGAIDRAGLFIEPWKKNVEGTVDILNDARVNAWKPPPRPEWVARINEEGTYFDLDGVVPLDENSLLDAARARTGLSDFGEGDWRESFGIFVKGLREEANLTLMGRLMARSDIVNILAARLEIEETYRRHPEIEDERIEKPVMIVGQGRTGTSLLLNVLSQDPDNGSLRHWECMYPCPPPEKENYFSDPRIAKADRLVEQWNRVNPEVVSCHEFNALVPTEASHALTLSFTHGAFLALVGQSPTHTAYSEKRGMESGLAYQKRLLKLLQWKNPRKHWILKSPDAILYMPALLKAYPDMNFAWTHRDPLKAAGSVVNMYGNCMYIRSDRPLVPGILDLMLSGDLAAVLLNQPIEWMESGVVPKERVCNIKFLDLESDPVAEVEKMYRQFGMTMTERALAAMRKYMRDNPRSARPPARYESVKQPAEREVMRRYQEYFGVADEF
jgi:hypothetical protein